MEGLGEAEFELFLVGKSGFWVSSLSMERTLRSGIDSESAPWRSALQEEWNILALPLRPLPFAAPRMADLDLGFG
ncbi:hypothetical protein [Bryobacter aggregatus]|uniref:hypothetical protein n=1 Tax=Bryobacter aggregatus TaxID=360054 RepID=UPI0004E1C8F9|nr:hypothetical protein [Bryobacter aggregatus]